MTKKIIVDQNLCIGCNTCALIAPEIFELDQTTFKAKVKKQPEKIEPIVETAVSSCPVTAISIVEE